MPKKKNDKKGSILDRYARESLQFLVSLLEEGTGDLIRKFGNILNFKKRLRKLFIFLILIAVSIAIFLIGVAEFAESLFPILKPGTTHILLSIAVILIALIYKKFY